MPITMSIKGFLQMKIIHVLHLIFYAWHKPHSWLGLIGFENLQQQ